MRTMQHALLERVSLSGTLSEDRAEHDSINQTLVAQMTQLMDDPHYMAWYDLLPPAKKSEMMRDQTDWENSMQAASLRARYAAEKAAVEQYAIDRRNNLLLGVCIGLAVGIILFGALLAYILWSH